jgi:hypothetical protein
MGIDQTTLLILSIQPGTRTHLPPLLVSSPLSHPRNLVKVPATKSRSAGRPAQLRLQRKEAQREGARPQLLGRRGLHQPWRRPWASSSSSPNAGRGASAGSATSCRPDASRWPHCSCGGLLRPLSVPLLHRFFRKSPSTSLWQTKAKDRVMKMKLMNHKNTESEEKCTARCNPIVLWFAEQM